MIFRTRTTVLLAFLAAWLVVMTGGCSEKATNISKRPTDAGNQVLFSYHDDIPGTTTLNDFKSRRKEEGHAYHCQLPDRGIRSCKADMDSGLTLYTFVDDRLANIFSIFSSDSAASLAKSMTTKHGPPTVSGPPKNRVWTWPSDYGGITISEHIDSVGHGAIMMFDAELDRDLMKRKHNAI